VKKLQAIQDALIAAKVARPEQIHGVADDGTPLQSAGLTATGVIVLHHQYKGHITLKQFAADLPNAVPVRLVHLMAVAMIWIQEQGEQYDTFDSWEGETADDHSSTVTLHFSLTEDVHAVPAPGYTGGDFLLIGGAPYKLLDDAPTIATTLGGGDVTETVDTTTG
jgi:hypothetical protein